jgi:integrase/recombinase XerD
VLRVYWKARRPQSTLLFPAPDGTNQLTRDTVRYAVRLAAQRAGITKKVNPHLLRHSFATHMMELGTDIRTLQILLGHRSLSSTTRYVHLTEARRQTLSSPVEALNTEQGRVLG